MFNKYFVEDEAPDKVAPQARKFRRYTRTERWITWFSVGLLIVSFILDIIGGASHEPVTLFVGAGVSVVALAMLALAASRVLAGSGKSRLAPPQQATSD